MFRQLIYLFSVVFVLSWVSGVSAQDAVIPSPGTMPVLDGNIDEVWFFSAEQKIETSQVGAAPSSPADCSGTWRALWNWEALYVLVEVTDDSLTNDSGEEAINGTTTVSKSMSMVIIAKEPAQTQMTTSIPFGGITKYGKNPVQSTTELQA